MVIKFIRNTDKWFKNEVVELPDGEAKNAIENKEAVLYAEPQKTAKDEK